MALGPLWPRCGFLSDFPFFPLPFSGKSFFPLPLSGARDTLLSDGAAVWEVDLWALRLRWRYSSFVSVAPRGFKLDQAASAAVVNVAAALAFPDAS